MKKRIISIDNPKSHIAEAYRGIRTSIEFSNIDKDLKVICITSSQQNEGKSTVISNLAVSFANLDKRVLLMEGDLRNPSVHRMFNLSNIYGLTDVLFAHKTFLECINTTSINNLHVLTCGAMPINPSEVLSSKTMREFLEQLKEAYDYIFIDAPPIGIVTDSGIISTYSDGVVFVVGSNETDVNLAKISKERLEKVNANILGVVLNKFDVSKNSGYEYYNYYYQEQSDKNYISNKSKRGKK